VLVVAGYAGLVLGGYLPVSPPLESVVEAVWSRGWS
jgi:hypothetical protein